MTRDVFFKMVKAALMVVAVGVSAPLAAMPTSQEISQAEPLVQEVMKSEMDALRSGKKTREQVGDAAVAFAKQTQAPAEKYILLTGAFDQYVRGGVYEKANGALVAIRTAIPDWKQSDELALVDKAMRSVAFGKGGPVRERHEALKERQQYALKLKKAQTLAQAKPTDKKLQFQVAAYHAALGEWPAALDGFIAGSNPACAAAAKLEKESAPPTKVADAWWSVVDIRPTFLSSAIRAHAVDLYKKALASNSLAGLQKVAAEKRIAEAESSAVEAAAKLERSTTNRRVSNSEAAQFYGVKLVGQTVKNKAGVLSDFSNGSYALIDMAFSPGNATIEAVVEFSMPANSESESGILSGIGWKNSFTPFYVKNSAAIVFLSSTGKTWDIASALPLDLPLRPKETYRLKYMWNGKEHVWFVWRGSWSLIKKLSGNVPVAGGLQLQLGTNRGLSFPFEGIIDLNKCYIRIDGKLWWEGVKGACKNANR